MTIDDRSAIGVIGAGRVGSALAHALLAVGRPLDAVASRTRAHADALASELPFVASAEIDELVASSDIVFLAVPDDAIEKAAHSIVWRPTQAVVHLSGGRGLDALAAVAEAGGIVGGLHPLQTFPGDETAAAARARFQGIVCGIEAPAPLDAVLANIVEELGGRSFRLEGVDRAAYHAAAVFVSNDVVAVMAAAARAWALAGLPVDEARGALSALLTASAAAIAGRPLTEALTGPVARGDVETVRRHLAALESEPELMALYRGLGAELLRLDLGHDAHAAAALWELLDGPGA
jgi:predicted short-subunit dehydrogenase-like oxidoreductase (DUF2520 family)